MTPETKLCPTCGRVVQLTKRHVKECKVKAARAAELKRLIQSQRMDMQASSAGRNTADWYSAMRKPKRDK